MIFFNKTGEGLKDFGNKLNESFNNFGEQLTKSLNTGSTKNNNNNNFEPINYPADSLDDTTTLIIIGSVVLIGFLLIQKK